METPKQTLQKRQINKTIFLFLSLVAWIYSSQIADYCFPANTEQDINNYWDLKKIIYSICIVLIVLAGEYKSKLSKFLALVFIGVLSQDITDRLQKITYLQFSDLIVFDAILLSSFYTIYKNDFDFKVFIPHFLRNLRD